MAPSPPHHLPTKDVSTHRPPILTHRSLVLICLAVLISVCFVPSYANKAQVAPKEAQPTPANVQPKLPTLPQKSPDNSHPKTSNVSDPVSNKSDPSKAQCMLNRSYSEMFCQFGPVTPTSKAMESQIKLILAKYDEKNDDRITEDFHDAQVDRSIAQTISKVIKQFFNSNFCSIVSQVMSMMARMESEEVRSPIAKVTAINTFINRLETSLEHAKATKHYEPKIVQLIQSLLKSLHDAAQKSLTELRSLENKLGNIRPAGNELSYARKHILVTLVDMFFSETVLRKTTGISESFHDLTTDWCFEEKQASKSAELEVACAFRFLFDSSLELKELITTNFDHEEELAYQNILEHPQLAAQSCSSSRDAHSQVAESSCQLKDLIENHHECNNIHVEPGHPNPTAIDCIKTQIQTKFPAHYQNKLLVGLNTGGPNGLLYSLKSMCLDKSAFVAFSVLDVGSYFQNVLLMTNNEDEETLMELDPKTNADRVPDVLRKQYIVESVIMYFLRAAEQRMTCSIKPMAGM